MHQVAAFDIADPGPLLAQLVAVSAATLVHPGPEGLTSTVLPLLYDASTGQRGTLVGHVARANPLVTSAAAQGDRLDDVLVVASGVEGYVSPSWYPSKGEHHRVVPTWDYVTVEAGGPLLLHREPEQTLAVVRRLTERHEQRRPDPWAVDDAPEAFITGQLRGIVAVEIPIQRWAAKAKLSQNRPAPDRAGVVAGLHADGVDSLAAAVEWADPDGASPGQGPNVGPPKG